MDGIKLLLYPEVWIFIGLSTTCLLAWATRCSRSIRLMLTLLLVLYYGFTTRPLAQALVQPLETYYRPPAAMPTHQDAIVLFVNHPPTLLPFTERPTIVGTRNADLLLCGLSYMHTHSAPKIVLGEGMPGVLPNHVPGTGVLQEWAALLGYPQEAIITNDRGIATHDRARAIKQLLGSQTRIVLIDAAIHLPRSAAAFQKAGFAVTPIPCDYYNLSTNPWSLFEFVPSADNLV